jgi:hypothetical protein
LIRFCAARIIVSSGPFFLATHVQAMLAHTPNNTILHTTNEASAAHTSAHTLLMVLLLPPARICTNRDHPTFLSAERGTLSAQLSYLIAPLWSFYTSNIIVSLEALRWQRGHDLATSCRKEVRPPVEQPESQLYATNGGAVLSIAYIP